MLNCITIEQILKGIRCNVDFYKYFGEETNLWPFLKVIAIQKQDGMARVGCKTIPVSIEYEHGGDHGKKNTGSHC